MKKRIDYSKGTIMERTRCGQPQFMFYFSLSSIAFFFLLLGLVIRKIGKR